MKGCFLIVNISSADVLVMMFADINIILLHST